MSKPDSPSDTTPARTGCAICGKPRVAVYEPFCSKRCADVDLHRWLGGTYAVPGDPVGDEEDGRPSTAPDGDH